MKNFIPSKIRFSFELRCDISRGSLHLWATRKFHHDLQYNTSSPVALTLLKYDDEEEEGNGKPLVNLA